MADGEVDDVGRLVDEAQVTRSSRSSAPRRPTCSPQPGAVTALALVAAHRDSVGHPEPRLSFSPENGTGSDAPPIHTGAPDPGSPFTKQEHDNGHHHDPAHGHDRPAP